MKFVCNPLYAEISDSEVIEADTAKDAAAEMSRRRQVADHEAHDKRQEKKKPHARLPFKPRRYQIVTIDVETGEKLVWSVKPPPRPPIEEWNWSSVPLDKFHEDDEDDEMDDEEDD